jgi:hypothetical protein
MSDWVPELISGSEFLYDTKDKINANFGDLADHVNAPAPHIGHESLVNKGQPNGYASLDGTGKVPTSQIALASLGVMDYQGLWDCSIGSYPTDPLKGYYYVCSASGTISGISYRIGDWLVYDGALWEKIENAVAVRSVAGKIGDVTLVPGDIGLENVTNDTQLKASQLDTDVTLTANSTSKIASQSAVKAYMDTGLATKQPNIGFTPENASKKGAINGYPGLDANQFVIQNPASSTSVPTPGKIPLADGNGFLNSWLQYGNIVGTVCQGNDSRLSDNRTPTAHDLISSFHTITGLSTGQVLRAASPTSVSFGQIEWGDINKTVSSIWDITNKSHTLLTDVGINSHLSIDSHIADITKHRVINDAGITSTDIWSASKTAAAISAAISGIVEYQEAVIDKDISTPPVSPVTGDRYIVKATGTGAWSGHSNAIATWDGSTWIFVSATQGLFTYVEDEGLLYVFNGTSWLPINNYALASVKPGAVLSSTSGQVGVAVTLARQDHSHDLGTHAHSDVSNGGQISYASLSGTPTTFAPIIGTTSVTACAGNDSRLSDARTPTTHGATAHTGTIGDHASQLSNVGSNSHAQIDSHIAAAAPHTGHALLSHSHAASQINPGTFPAGTFTFGNVTITGASNGNLAVLSDAATVTPDFATSDNFSWTLGAAGRTLANPVNPTVGQSGVIFLIQDATGGRTITSWGSSFKFPGGTTPTLSTAGYALDVLTYFVRASNSIVCQLVKGFA